MSRVTSFFRAPTLSCASLVGTHVGVLKADVFAASGSRLRTAVSSTRLTELVVVAFERLPFDGFEVEFRNLVGMTSVSR
jgi:hypothetical protein